MSSEEGDSGADSQPLGLSDEIHVLAFLRSFQRNLGKSFNLTSFCVTLTAKGAIHYQGFTAVFLLKMKPGAIEPSLNVTLQPIIVLSCGFSRMLGNGFGGKTAQVLWFLP